MAIKQLNPYLNFNGTAAQAVKLYEKALDAKVESIQRFGDIPGTPAPPETKDRVMHAVLRLGEGTIMLSDTQPEAPASPGGPIWVTLDFDDPAEMGRKFEALSVGGKVTMPLQETFWGAKFGMLVDAHGIQWMFNCTIRR
jgi:PhnB protein